MNTGSLFEKLFEKLEKIPDYEPPYIEGKLATGQEFRPVLEQAVKLEQFVFWEMYNCVIERDTVFKHVPTSYVKDAKILTFLLDDRGYKALVDAELSVDGSKAKNRFDAFQKALRAAGFAGMKVAPGKGSKNKGYNRYYLQTKAAHMKAFKEKLLNLLAGLDKKLDDNVMNAADVTEIVNEGTLLMNLQFPPPVTRSLVPTAINTQEEQWQRFESALTSEKEQQDQQPKYRALGESSELDLRNETNDLIHAIRQAIERKVWQAPSRNKRSRGGASGGASGSDVVQNEEAKEDGQLRLRILESLAATDGAPQSKKAKSEKKPMRESTGDDGDQRGAGAGGGHEDGSGWTCIQCTFLNENAGYLACEMCSKARRE
jgi:hypothetical protein